MLPATSADMLLSFSVDNSRSLLGSEEAPVTLSLVTEEEGDEETVTTPWNPGHSALTCLALFGANGAGKTNVLTALGDMATAVLDSCRAWTGWDNLPHAPFLLDDTSAHQPSYYEVDLLLDGVRWTYGFELSARRVEAEWIHSYPQGTRHVWLDRNAARDQVMRWPDGGVTNVPALEQMTRDNALVLSTAGAVGERTLAPLYRWFTTVTGPVTANDQERHQETLTALRADSVLRTRLGQLLNVADPILTGITLDPITHEVLFIHYAAGEKPVALPWKALAHGTRCAVTTLAFALRALDNGHRLLLDDFTSGLHPRLSAEIIRLFTTPWVNTRRAQLILATHDASLLGPVHCPVLTPHQTVLATKDSAGATSLTPLASFETGEREDIQRSYLDGAFGGIPSIPEGAVSRRLHR